jgi:hypothetical protein
MKNTVGLGCILLSFSWLLISNNPALAQEKVIVPSKGTFTWEELLQLGKQRSTILEGPIAVHAPLAGPGPREIGAPHAVIPEGAAGRSSAVPPDATLTQSPPSVSFLALEDNEMVIPPDTHGAVGPAHVMTMLNSDVRVQDKVGGTISTMSLADFWSAINGTKFDPKVLYDPGSGRWIATCDANAASSSSKVCLAVSTTNDPTDAWSFFEFDADPADVVWADYPGIGVNATWIAITNNMFRVDNSMMAGAGMWVVDKSTVLSAGTATATVFPAGFDNGGGFTGFTLQPCQTFGSEPTLYIADNSGLSFLGTFLLRLSRITGTGSSPSWSVVPGSLFTDTGLLPVANNFTFSQPDADQMGSLIKVETNDSRMLNAVFRSGSIWCTHSAGLPAGGTADRTSVFWYELDPTALPAPIVQSGMVDGGTGVHHFFPSISANAAGDAVVGFSRSSAATFPQAAYAGRLNSDPLNTIRPVDVIKDGESYYTKFFSGTRNRWGDYSATVVDPVDDNTFWTIQEYAAMRVGTDTVSSGRWGTWWAQITPSGELPIQMSYFKGALTTEGKVRLDWQTVSEVNNYGFEVQKLNDRTAAFQTVPGGFVPGAGTSVQPQTYSFVDESTTPGLWWYRLRQIDLDGSVHLYDPIRLDVVTGVADAVPVRTALYCNYPNPFNPSTVFRYTLAQKERVRIVVYNMLGQAIATVMDGEENAGEHSVEWRPERIGSGTYLYTFTAGSMAESRKLMLLR